jgi:hypothetical protein
MFPNLNLQGEKARFPSGQCNSNQPERRNLYGKALLSPPSYQCSNGTARSAHYGQNTSSLDKKSEAVARRSLEGPTNRTARSTSMNRDSNVTYRMPHSLNGRSASLSRHFKDAMSSRDGHQHLQVVGRRSQDEQQMHSNRPSHSTSSKKLSNATERNTFSERHRPQSVVEKRFLVDPLHHASSSDEIVKLPSREKSFMPIGQNLHVAEKKLVQRSASVELRRESNIAKSEPKRPSYVPSANISASNSEKPPWPLSSNRCKEKYRSDREMDPITFSFKTGLCSSCGQQIRKRINPFSGAGLYEVPLTVPNRVYKGQCLICNPFNGVFGEHKVKTKGKKTSGLRNFLRMSI